MKHDYNNLDDTIATLYDLINLLEELKIEEDVD